MDPRHEIRLPVGIDLRIPNRGGFSYPGLNQLRKGNMSTKNGDLKCVKSTETNLNQ